MVLGTVSVNIKCNISLLDIIKWRLLGLHNFKNRKITISELLEQERQKIKARQDDA